VKNSWPLVSLGELIRLERRPVEVIPALQYQEIGIYCFGKGIFHKTPRSGLEVGDKNLYEIREGDLILQVTFAWEGAIALCTKAENGLYGSTRYPTFRVNEERCFAPFLARYLVTRDGLEQINKICPGSAGRNRVLNLKWIDEIKVPLPPVPEQWRIVARIEELAAKIQEARTLRERGAEEGDILLHSGVEAVFQKLRDKFGTETLSDVCHTITDGDHNTPNFSDEGVRFIFVGNVSSARLHFENNKRVSAEYFETLKPQRLPKRGDILYSAVGATLGIPAVVDTDEPFCFQRHVAILKPNRERVESRFVWHMLRSRTVFEKAWDSTTGSAQPTVPLRAIRELPIPVPLLSEQCRIVAELDVLQAQVDALRKLQAETTAELDALLPSILDKAFKGAL
jgi:type I restriction enzyme, S subunit